ncbi:MAG TPA: ISKra4 family transposase [Anaerolineales bacterium]|nr:ISKra4 family transposase [Anaerolineales bacterium]
MAWRVDLEATEMAIRSSMHGVGGVLLERLLDSDLGYRGSRVQCRQGHEAEFIDYRSKEVLTVLSRIRVRRAYYHCTPCQEGLIPKDSDLDVVGTSFSPGVRRLMGRVGGKEPFAEGRRDLEELAGIVVKTKEVERVSEAIGEQMEAIAGRQRAAAFSGRIVLLPKPVPKMYIAIDGTGVPMVPRETEGRQGKDPGGKAKTREAKLGCVFTQTTVDDEGWPVRDDDSTTYVGAIETSEQFGPRIFTEAIRRGIRCAEKVIVLGDGAPWIWTLAGEHFPGATQIVDLYHAREHLSDLAKVLYGPGSSKGEEWAKARIDELDDDEPENDEPGAGGVEAVLAAMGRLRPTAETAQDELRKVMEYFQTNAERMRYQQFRRQGLFVGSGVVEAGCRTIVGRRLKQSGMHWTVRGANAILTLRCWDLSGRWEHFWEARSA